MSKKTQPTENTTAQQTGDQQPVDVSEQLDDSLIVGNADTSNEQESVLDSLPVNPDATSQPAGGQAAQPESPDGPGEQTYQEVLLDHEGFDEDQKRAELINEINRLIDRLRSFAPDYAPPEFNPRRMFELLGERIETAAPGLTSRIQEKMHSGIGADLFDLDTWKGIWFVLSYTVEFQKDFLKRRFTGEYETDEWGYDPELMSLFKPFVDFMYSRYWRVQTSGIERIPVESRALLVSNHSGQLPFDGAMIGMAVMQEHESQRLVRSLYASWFPTLPFVSSFLVKMGQAMASEENGIRLLKQEQLVSVFPEGIKGVGKVYKDRYKLARFGRGGFVRMALKTQAPIIPVSVVGAEEIYISLYNAKTIARLIGFPFFPISVTWPWFGLLGFVPLPTKWYIDFGEPIPTDGYPADAHNNLNLVSELTDQVRNTIQKSIYDRLAERRSIFFG